MSARQLVNLPKGDSFYIVTRNRRQIQSMEDFYFWETDIEKQLCQLQLKVTALTVGASYTDVKSVINSAEQFGEDIKEFAMEYAEYSRVRWAIHMWDSHIGNKEWRHNNEQFRKVFPDMYEDVRKTIEKGSD